MGILVEVDQEVDVALWRLCSTHDAAEQANIAGVVASRDGENRLAMCEYQTPKWRGGDKGSFHALSLRKRGDHWPVRGAPRRLMKPSSL